MTDASRMGKVWRKEQFAGFGAKSNSGSAKSGAFLARLAALRDYGLITSDKETIVSTDLAQRIVKPVSPDERGDAIRQAFLSVGTFNELYNALDGNEPLPRNKVAQHAVFNLGVSRDSMERFINVFVESGKYAGLVRYDKDASTITLLKPDVVSRIDQPQTVNGTAAGSPPILNSRVVSTPVVAVTSAVNAAGDAGAQNEQGVNHAGNGWSLTVLVKSSHRLPADLRKSIRDLLESADSVADHFYELENEGE